MTLEEKLMQMGAEPTETLLASTRQHEQARQQTRKGLRTGPPAANGAGGQTAALRNQFVAAVGRGDEELQVERVGSEGQRPSKTTIKDVYQPTGLANGHRVGGGERDVRQLQLGNNPTPSTSLPDLQFGLANLTFAQATALQPPMQPSRVQGTSSNVSALDRFLLDTMAGSGGNSNPQKANGSSTPVTNTTPAVNGATATVQQSAAPAQDAEPKKKEAETEWLIEL